MRREELSNGNLDCVGARHRALYRAVGSILHHRTASREGARTHVVHTVEAARPFRHRLGRRVSPDSSGRGRRPRGALLIRRASARRSHRPFGLWILTTALLASPLIHAGALVLRARWLNFGSVRLWDGFVYF